MATKSKKGERGERELQGRGGQ